MGTRDAQRARERQVARQRAAAAAAHRAARNRRLVAAGVLVAVLLASMLAFVGASNELDDQADPTTTTADPTTTEDSAGPPSGTPVDVPLPLPGATITGPPPCPPTDGTAARTTSFDTPPPMCLTTAPDGSVDLGITYKATLRTSVGDLVYLLDTERAPEAVNSFVTLARYHYWDGVPVDTAVRTAWAELGGELEGGAPGATYRLSTETPEPGSIPVPGFLAASPDPADDGLTATGGRLVMVLGENGAELPTRTTFFALLLDGTEAFAAINRAATETGQPSAVITIDEVVITEEPADT